MRNKMKKKQLKWIGWILILAALFFTSCPKPIDQVLLSQVEDAKGPVIVITSPEDNSNYTQTVTVQGSVYDEGGELRSVIYTITGTLGVLGSGEIPLAQIGVNGSFSFQFVTTDFNGPIVVTVIAEDWNDNINQTSIILEYPGSSLSSFTAVASNKQVQLSWDMVGGDASYTVYYTTNGTFPTDSYYEERITLTDTSLNLTGLKNGALHIFLLKASIPGGATYWSSYKKVIPLSEMTLAPLVTGGYREIRLEWTEIQATDEFEVYRATSYTGPYENYTGVIRGYNFVDTNIVDGTWYYYKVRPALVECLTSIANGAQTVRIPLNEESRMRSIDSPGTANRVRVSGNYAYVAAGTAGLLVVDISDPVRPRIVTSLPTTNAQDIDLYQNSVYVADGSGGLKVIDISNPLDPVQTGSYTGAIVDAFAVSVCVENTTPQRIRTFLLDAIDTSGNTRLHALDATNPVSIAFLDDHQNPSYRFSDVDASYYDSNLTFIYLTTSNTDQLLEFYLYTTSTPTYTIYEYHSDTNDEYNPDRVVVKGSYVYALSTAKAYLEPPPPYAVVVFSKYPLSLSDVSTSAYSNGYVADITEYDNMLYIADSRGLQIYDITADPMNPVRGDFWNTPGVSLGAHSDGRYGYVAAGALGFQTVDLASPTELSIVGSYDASGGGLNGLVVRENYAYAAAGYVSPTLGSRLQVIDISDPTNPTDNQCGYLEMQASTVALSGPYAFVPAGEALNVVNISNPASPTLTGSAPGILGWADGAIAVKGDYAYVAGGMGLHIYDIADPAQPVGIAFYDSDGGGINGVAIRGRYLYITDGAYFQPNSLKILDISNPVVPAFVGKSLTIGMTVWDVSLFGDYAFVTDEFPDQGVFAVNINPDSTNFLSDYGPCDTMPGDYPNTGWSQGLVAFGNYAYVADPQSGLALVDISNPSSISDSNLLQALDWTDSDPQNVVLNGKHALVSDTSEGLKIIELFP
jgi:hypothetical protein